MTSNQQIPSSTPLKYAVESSSSYGSSSSNNLPLPSPSPKLSPGKSRHHVVALQWLKTATLDGVYYASSLHPHLYLLPWFSINFDSLSVSVRRRNELSNWIMPKCLSTTQVDMMVLLYGSEFLKISPSLVLWTFHPRFLTFFSVNLCYPSMLNHCHLLYIYDNIQ